MSVYEQIENNSRKGKKMLAVLLDPDKSINLSYTINQINKADVDMILVGGSGYNKSIDSYIDHLRSLSRGPLCPIVLFPGDICQFSPNADALLFLSLISSRNAELLIGRHVQVAKKVYDSGIENIPMGYILIDGGKTTTVQKITHSTPLTDTDEIVSTAITGELLGKKLIYLEAGSGANKPVDTDVIRQVRQHLSIPLIVGGGICIVNDMLLAVNAGADIIVVGNHFEKHPEQISLFAKALKEYNQLS